MKTRILKVLLACFCCLTMSIAKALPTVTITGLNTPGPGGNGITSGSLNYGQNSIVVYGFQVTCNTATTTFQTIKVTWSGQQVNSYFSGFQLYSSSTNNYTTGSPAPVTSTVAISNGDITISGINKTFNAVNQTVYYFLVANYSVQGATPQTLQFNYNTSTYSTSTTVNITSTNGNSFSMPTPAVTVTGINATGPTGNGITTGSLSYGQNPIVMYGFQVTATTPATTFQSIKITGSNTVSNYFTGLQLYSSTTNNYTTGMLTPVGTASSSNSDVTVTGINTAFTTANQTLYYFLVANYSVQGATAATYQFKYNTSTFSGGATATSVTTSTTDGNNFTLAPPVLTITPSSTGVTTTAAVTAGVPVNIFGFTLTWSNPTNMHSMIIDLNFPLGGDNFSGDVSSIGIYDASTNLAASHVTVTNNNSNLALNFDGTKLSGSTSYYIKVTFDFSQHKPLAFSACLNSSNSSNAAGNACQNTTNCTITPYTSVCGSTYYSSTTYDWTGETSSAWATLQNWRVNGSTPTVLPGQYDAVRIGVSTSTITGSGGNNGQSATSFISQPLVTDNRLCNSINFGPAKAATLTVNGAAVTLAAGSSILQNHNVSSGYTTTLAGTGIITCSTLQVGDNTVPNSGTNYTTKMVSGIGTLTLSSDLTLNSTAASLNTIGVVNANPYFSLTGGTMNIAGQIVTTNQNLALSANPTCSFSVDAANTTLNLSNAAALNIANTNYATIDFCYATGTGTVNYNGANQTVYNSTTSVLSTTPYMYSNLTLSGTGTATAGVSAGGTLTVGNNLTTSTTTTTFAAYNPTITVGNSWTNTTNTTQGSGDIIVVGYTQNTAGTLQLGAGNLTTGGIQNSGGTIQGGTVPGKVTVGPSLFQNNGGTYVCNAEDLFINGDYQNTSIFTAGTGTVYFNGSAAQSLQDISSAGTTFNNVSFSGIALTNPKTMSGSGGFAVSATGTLSLANNATTKLNAGGVLTLKSNASSTATVAQIKNTTSKITGVVNVQRYITGGSGYRGYRLMSSPVNVSLNTGGGGSTGLTYIGKSPQPSFGGTTFNGAFTGGPGSGFTTAAVTNPSLYLYDESLTSNNTSFVAGKNVGIYAITSDSTVTITSGKPALQTTGVKIPVGNSFLFFFIGDNSKTTTSSASRPSPENTTVTSYGYLNQGNVLVNFWSKANTQNNTAIPYHTGTGGVLPGYNQLGNPYASTIDLTRFYPDNSGAISNIFWEMNEPGQKYISYQINSSGAASTSDPKASQYIVSGQGFIIQGLNTGNKTVTFYEADKTSYPTGFVSTNTTSPALLMSTKDDISLFNRSLASSVAEENPLTGLHMQINKDSITNAACGIYFSKTNHDNFHDAEDAIDLDGGNIFMSSYSLDGVRTGINQLADYKEKGKRIKLYIKAATSGLYKLNLLDIKNIDTVNYKIYLVDKYKKDSLDIGRYKTYAFNLTTSDTSTFGANRFELSINQVPASKYQLASFTAQKATDGILLTWRTLNEGNNYFFTLEKQQVNGTDYSPLYNIQSNGGTIYKYTDKTPNTGNNMYRLKQVDLFGNITYSNPVNIYYDKSGNAGMFSVYPNPTAETLNVNITYGLTNTAATSYKLNIYDATGSLVMQKTSDASKWSENVSQFKPGIYIVELKGNSGISLGKTKFVKQ